MSEVDSKLESPWLGPESFSEADSHKFFGRTYEKSDLRRRLQRNVLTVLFGDSGLGKTSLIRAGLFPDLRKKWLTPVYIRLQFGEDSESLLDQIWSKIDDVVPVEKDRGKWPRNLWAWFNDNDKGILSESLDGASVVLVFDQFEEVFTKGSSERWSKQSAEFLNQLADLAENRIPEEFVQIFDSTTKKNQKEAEKIRARYFDSSGEGLPPYRILLSLRADYLFLFDRLATQLPSAMRRRMELKPLGQKEALEAIQKPAPDLIAKPVAEIIADRLNELPDTIYDLDLAAESKIPVRIVPALLSMVCDRLNKDRLKAGRKTISEDQIEEKFDLIFESYYHDVFNDLGERVRSALLDAFGRDEGSKRTCSLAKIKEDFGEGQLQILLNEEVLQPSSSRPHELKAGSHFPYSDEKYAPTKTAPQSEDETIFELVELSPLEKVVANVKREVEGHLVDNNEHRNLQLQDTLEKAIGKVPVELLVTKRLLQVEERDKKIFVEIIHDRFAEVASQSKRVREEEDAVLKRAREVEQEKIKTARDRLKEELRVTKDEAVDQLDETRKAKESAERQLKETLEASHIEKERLLALQKGFFEKVEESETLVRTAKKNAEEEKRKAGEEKKKAEEEKARAEAEIRKANDAIKKSEKSKRKAAIAVAWFSLAILVVSVSTVLTIGSKANRLQGAAKAAEIAAKLAKERETSTLAALNDKDEELKELNKFLEASLQQVEDDRADYFMEKAELEKVSKEHEASMRRFLLVEADANRLPFVEAENLKLQEQIDGLTKSLLDLKGESTTKTPIALPIGVKSQESREQAAKELVQEFLEAGAGRGTRNQWEMFAEYGNDYLDGSTDLSRDDIQRKIEASRRDLEEADYWLRAPVLITSSEMDSIGIEALYGYELIKNGKVSHGVSKSFFRIVYGNIGEAKFKRFVRSGRSSQPVSDLEIFEFLFSQRNQLLFSNANTEEREKWLAKMTHDMYVLAGQSYKEDFKGISLEARRWIQSQSKYFADRIDYFSDGIIPRAEAFELLDGYNQLYPVRKLQINQRPQVEFLEESGQWMISSILEINHSNDVKDVSGEVRSEMKISIDNSEWPVITWIRNEKVGSFKTVNKVVTPQKKTKANLFQKLFKKSDR